MENRYNVIFNGEIKEGADISVVKEKIAVIFKRKNDSTIDDLFTRGNTVIKKNVDHETALKVSAYFDTSGAISVIQPIADAVAVNAPAAAQSPLAVEENKPVEIAESKLPLRRSDDVKKCSFCGKVLKAAEPICPHCSRPQRMSWKCDNCGKQIPNYRDICVCGFRKSAGTVSDTKACPSCGEEIKRAAKKCRFCNHIIDASILADSQGSLDLKEAKNALIYALVGLLCFGIILGPIAIYKSIAALNKIKENPQFRGRNKAIAGIIIGILDILGFLIFVLSKVK